MNLSPQTRRPSEDGYILVAVMFMLALLIIAMAVAAPKIAAMTMLPWNERQLQWTDAATVGCGLLAIALLYACADRLLGELRRARVAGAGGTP